MDWSALRTYLKWPGCPVVHIARWKHDSQAFSFVINLEARKNQPIRTKFGTQAQIVGRPVARGGLGGSEDPLISKCNFLTDFNLSLCEKRWKRGRNGRLKTVHQTQHASSLELKLFWGALRAPFWAPLGPPGPGSSCPVGSKTCHVLPDDCQKSQTGPKSVDSKETTLF